MGIIGGRGDGIGHGRLFVHRTFGCEAQQQAEVLTAKAKA
jgi:hypothetical protein